MEGCHRDRVLEGNIVDQDQLRRPLGPLVFPGLRVPRLSQLEADANPAAYTVGIVSVTPKQAIVTNVGRNVSCP
jgi:hypothetical protein